ncbi:MAG TPA: GTPase HflX [Nitrospiraceae bacterium]|nr:GTPase HflX [Nitrospiraceae bacterium]HCZ10677.1 GTPase HflX [Nitrospiraceae bacterium]
MATIYGNISGLKKSVLYSLEKIYRRKIPANKLITVELARYLTELSFEIGKQIGIIANRGGVITHVVVGDARSVFIPGLDDFPLGRSALRGLRFIHTHLTDEPLNREDITDLSLLRFDMIAAVSVREGLPYNIYAAHLMPYGSDKKHETITSDFYRFDLDFRSFIASLEDEMDRRRVIDRKDKRERAILVSASTKPKYEIEDSMEELKELAVSSDVIVLDAVIQRLKNINPKYVLGEGKLKDLVVNSMDKGATLLIFDQDLTPSQIRAIAETGELKVIDRSQLILDIFARRAHSRDGKVQVELAQLKYMLPRLTGKGTAMSRLTGGIGGRGPGEMKLEIDRRRIREKITRLERELDTLSEARKQRKQRRVGKGIPIVSIIGYTNAGKSTLLNTLTKSATIVEDKMFATLDTASRRLRFPKEREIIITDTVGFIRDLPKDLMAAFKATLEELEDADLLLHLVDLSNPRFEQQIASVENILSDLKIKDKPRLMIFNKLDKISAVEAENIISRYGAIGVSAIKPDTLQPLLNAIEQRIWKSQYE